MSLPVAGKTGTAEVGEWTTAVFIGYAPYEKPEVAFACVAPTSSVNSEDVAENICSTYVVPQALSDYLQYYPIEGYSASTDE